MLGYLTPEEGIIEVRDSGGESKKVAFHINDVWDGHTSVLARRLVSIIGILSILE